MYLKTLKVRDFAGLTEAELPALQPGLNVVVGHNEAGKSTLLLALRAAFFQKHRASGEAAKALAPYGRQARPEVDVVFDLQGTEYRLRKAFLQRAEAELSWAGGRLSGDGVEERLAELLGFAHPNRGEPKLGEHQGAFGLLWVEQGRSHGQDLDLGVGRNAVTASLEGEIGTILGGERGRALLAAARGRQDRFFTPTLRPKSDSPLRLAEETLESLRRERAEKDAALRHYEERLERLRSRREVLASYRRDEAEAEADRAVDLAEQKARTVAEAERLAAGAEEQLRHATGRRDAASERLDRRRKLAASAEAAALASGRSAEALLARRDEREREAREIAACEAVRDAARTVLESADAATEAAASQAERGRLRSDHAALVARLNEARAEAERLEALAPLLADPIDRKALDELEAGERARREAEIRLKQTAPAIRFEPLAGAGVSDETGEAVAAGEDVLLLAARRFRLEGFGDIVLSPGVDAGALRTDYEAAVRRQETRLSRLHVKDMAEARLRLAAKEKASLEAASIRSRLASLLPDGEAAAARRLSALAAALADLPEGSGDDADAASLRETRRAARDALGHAEATLDAARKLGAAAAAALAKAEAESEHRAEAAARLAAEHAAAEGERSGAALEEDLAAAEVERQAAAAVVALRRRTLEEADPETVTRSLQAARQAADEVRRTVRSLADEIIALEAELRAQGAGALGEEVERLGGEIEAEERRVERLRREADAVRLLHSTLLDAQREAREHWLAPIQAQVAPFLRLVHPETEIAFDEASLAITGLSRRGVDERFERLSAGAREQVAVVTRLAFAKVLKRGGQPAAVILDDALVNTDEARLQRMHMVLQKAAEDLQVIVLTCRERDFRGLGAPILRL